MDGWAGGRTHLPRRWLAVFLSFFSAGLGHIYCGRIARAACIAGALQLLIVLLNWLFAAGHINVIIVMSVPIVGTGIAIAIVVVFTVARDGSSNYPADRRPDLPRENFVNRIVGVPGDQLEFSGSNLIVNGEQMTTAESVGEFVDSQGMKLLVRTERLGEAEYQVLDSPDIQDPVSGPFLVEPGRYFVVGDNRDFSKDSRVFGTIRRDQILGPPSTIYWSWDFNGSYGELAHPGRLAELLRHHTRWSRIGLAVN